MNIYSILYYSYRWPFWSCSVNAGSYYIGYRGRKEAHGCCNCHSTEEKYIQKKQKRQKFGFERRIRSFWTMLLLIITIIFKNHLVVPFAEKWSKYILDWEWTDTCKRDHWSLFSFLGSSNFLAGDDFLWGALGERKTIHHMNNPTLLPTELRCLGNFWQISKPHLGVGKIYSQSSWFSSLDRIWVGRCWSFERVWSWPCLS